MKRLALVILLALTGVAQAQQQVQNVIATNRIDMVVGQTNLLRFNDAIGSIVFSQKDVVEGLPPQGDRQFAFVANKPGVSRLFVSGPDGRSLYDAEIVVTPEPGHMVKIYGTNKNDDLNAGYTAMFCTNTGCERPDKDLPKPTAVTVERVSRFKDGAVGSR